MSRALTNRIFLRVAGALLLGGVLLLGTACKGEKGFISFFPDRVSDKKSNKDAVQVEEQAEASIPSSLPASERPDARWYDHLTGLPVEASPVEENRPAGVAIPELAMVHFAFDSWELTPESKAALQKNIAYLKANPEIKVLLRGHTDDQGTEEYNLSLGSRRAQVVRQALIEMGIAPDRLETVSFGEGLPLQEGDDDASRAMNRRVEFFVYE
ncbi:OmpA family protein [bacterium]|nr:OmpA family protein [bacterium]